MQSTGKAIERSRIQSILSFWFGKDSDLNKPASGDSFRRWFMSNPETDDFITDNFRGDLDKLSAGDYEDWKADRDGKLAAIILTDQFTRNMFRKRKEAFAYDYIALGIAKSIPL